MSQSRKCAASGSVEKAAGSRAPWRAVSRISSAVRARRAGETDREVGGARLVVASERIVDRVVEEDGEVDGGGIAPAGLVGDEVVPAQDLGDVGRVVVRAVRLGVGRGEGALDGRGESASGAWRQPNTARG